MSAGASRRGLERERMVRVLLEERGWVVLRAAGSLGALDLVAIADGLVWHPSVAKPTMRIRLERAVLLVEVKSTARGPFHGFSPADRRELAWAAERCGAEAWLAWWPPRRELRWIPASSWPEARRPRQALPGSTSHQDLSV